MLHEGKVFLYVCFSHLLYFFKNSFQQSCVLFMVNKLTDYSKVLLSFVGWASRGTARK